MKKENKIKLFDEEKNNLVNNFFEKEKEFNDNKLKIVDLNQNIEKLNGELDSATKENEKLKKIYNELNNENNKLNLLLQESDDKLKQYEEKYNSLKSEKINNEKKANDLENLIENNNKIIKEKHDLENEIKKINSENKTILDDMIKSKSETENKCKDTIKENEKLQDKIKQLSILQDNLEEQLNTINIKYREAKKNLAEKEKELSALKEASQALIQKEKNKIEKDISIDPNKCKVITDKTYQQLKWYLLYEKPANENNLDEENKYENYRWVSSNVLKNEDLNKFNKYDTSENNINNLNYMNIMSKKLEKKEMEISELKYRNKKLAEEIHNKTAGEGLLAPISRGTSGPIKNRNKSKEIGPTGYKNILEELNKSNARERQLQNRIIKLNNELNNKNEESENKKSVKEYIKNDNDYGNENEDELKLAKEQMIMIKEDLKETKKKLEQLIGQVKGLIKNVKCDNKNKPYFAQICQILGYSPKTTGRILNNDKKGINF
jgi:chromosome segregation ATPase